MTRLPTPGSDTGKWGEILNDFLSQAHTSDGKLKTDSVTAGQLAPGSVVTPAIADGAITNSKLDIPTKASLAKADSAVQSSDLGTMAVETAEEYSKQYSISAAALASAASPSATIQALVDACAASGGGQVVLPPGSFTLDRLPLVGGFGASIKLPSNVHLKGSGRGVTVLTMSAASPVSSGERYFVVRIGDGTQSVSRIEISDLTLNAEAFRLAGTGSVFVIQARYDSPYLACHADDVSVHDVETIGGAIAIGCTKEGNAANAQIEPRLSQQYRRWSVHHNRIIRCTNKAVEMGECDGGEVAFNVCEEVTDGPQAIFSSRNIDIVNNQVTYTYSGINVTQGSSDILIAGNRCEAHANHGVGSRGALCFRTEDQAVASTLARVRVIGNTFIDQVTAGARVLAFQSRATTVSVSIEDVVFSGNRFVGTLDFHDVVNPAPAVCTVSGITWSANNTVEGNWVFDPDGTTYAGFGSLTAVLPAIIPYTATQSAWLTANQMRCSRFTLTDAAMVRYFDVAIGAQSGNIQVGILRMTGGLTYERVADSGIIACPAVGDQRIDLGVTLLPPGEYAFFFWADNTTVQVPASSATPAQPLRLLGAHSGLAGGVGASGTLSTITSYRTLLAAAHLT